MTTVATHELSQLHDVPVDVAVEVGRVMTTIGAVLALRRGSTVLLERPVSEPVDVIVAGKHVACAELVLVDDEVGVRITAVLEE